MRKEETFGEKGFQAVETARGKAVSGRDCRSHRIHTRPVQTGTKGRLCRDLGCLNIFLEQVMC